MAFNMNFFKNLGGNLPSQQMVNPQIANFAMQAARSLRSDPNVSNDLAGLVGAIGEDLAFGGGSGEVLSGQVTDRKPEHRRPYYKFSKVGKVQLFGGNSVLSALMAAAGGTDVSPFSATDSTRVLASATNDKAVLENHAFRALIPFVEITLEDDLNGFNAGARQLEEWLMRQFSLTIKHDNGLSDYALYNAPFGTLQPGYKLQPESYQLSLVNNNDFELSFDFPGVGTRASETLVDFELLYTPAMMSMTIEVGVVASLDPYPVYKARCEAAGLTPRNTGNI